MLLRFIGGRVDINPYEQIRRGKDARQKAEQAPIAQNTGIRRHSFASSIESHNLAMRNVMTTCDIDGRTVQEKG